MDAIFANPPSIRCGARPLAVSVQGNQIDNDVKAAARQMDMRRSVIAFANFEAILVIAKALLCGLVDIL